MEKWAINYQPTTRRRNSSSRPPPVTDSPFVLPHFTPQELADVEKGRPPRAGHAMLTGMPNPEVAEDDEGARCTISACGRTVPIDGQPWLAGGQEVPVQESPDHRRRFRHMGGNFARLIHPVVLGHGEGENPNAKASDAWGWVPPPLVSEGSKVQIAMAARLPVDPYHIRPAVVLRMPKFNMSSDEATQLANYFAAMDNAQYPYLVDHRTDSSYLAAQDTKHPNGFEDALKIITGNEYCVKCHKVGDFTPAGSPAGLAESGSRLSAATA